MVSLYILQKNPTGLRTYLLRLTPNTTNSYQTKTCDKATTYQCRVGAFKSSFFPWTITKLNV